LHSFRSPPFDSRYLLFTFNSYERRLLLSRSLASRRRKLFTAARASLINTSLLASVPTRKASLFHSMPDFTLLLSITL